VQTCALPILKVSLESSDGCGLSCNFFSQLGFLAVSQFLLRHLADTDVTFVILYCDGTADGKAKIFKPSALHLDLRDLGVGAAGAAAGVCYFDVFLLHGRTSLCGLRRLFLESQQASWFRIWLRQPESVASWPCS